MWSVFTDSKTREVANLISMEIDLKGVPLSCETIQKMRSAKIWFACHCHAQLILHLTDNKRHSKGDILASPGVCDVFRQMLQSCSSEICGQFSSTFGIFLPLSA